MEELVEWENVARAEPEVCSHGVWVPALPLDRVVDVVEQLRDMATAGPCWEAQWRPGSRAAACPNRTVIVKSRQTYRSDHRCSVEIPQREQGERAGFFSPALCVHSGCVRRPRPQSKQ